MTVSRLILDTNVIEYLWNPDPTMKNKATDILDSIDKGRYDGILCPPVIMELYYRLSDNLGEKNAVAFLKTLLAMPNMYLVKHTKEMGHSAGEFYYKYATKVRKKTPRKKVPSAVDCLIAGMCYHIQNSMICTNDQPLLAIVEVSSVPFQNVVT